MYADSKFYFTSCSGDKHLFPASLDGAFASVCIMSTPTLFRPSCLIFGFFLARVFFISPPLDCLEAARHVLYVFFMSMTAAGSSDVFYSLLGSLLLY